MTKSIQLKIYNKKPSSSEMKNGQTGIYFDKDRPVFVSKQQNKIWESFFTGRYELDVLRDPKVRKALALFSRLFSSDVKNGSGVNIWFDDMGEINLEVDVIRARQKVVNPQSEYAALQGQGGSVQTGQTAKIKKIRR